MATVLYATDFRGIARQDWKDCLASGDVSESVDYIVNRSLAVLRRIPRENLINHLVETGAWDREELVALDDRELFCKLVFVEASSMIEIGMVWID